jgi:hypothetical protein
MGLRSVPRAPRDSVRQEQELIDWCVDLSTEQSRHSPPWTLSARAVSRRSLNSFHEHSEIVLIRSKADDR